MAKVRHNYGPLIFAIVIAAAVSVSAVIVYAAHEGMQRRHDVCVEVEKVKTILRDEHRVTLERGVTFLHRHPQGLDGFSRGLILQSLADQRAVLKDLQPSDCKG